jgi:hypothetical protein
MPHSFERVPKDAEPHITLTDDILEAPVRVWVDYTPHGDADLCLVFEDGDAFRAWLDALNDEAERQNLTRRALG